MDENTQTQTQLLREIRDLLAEFVRLVKNEQGPDGPVCLACGSSDLQDASTMGRSGRFACLGCGLVFQQPQP